MLQINLPTKQNKNGTWGEIKLILYSSVSETSSPFLVGYFCNVTQDRPVQSLGMFIPGKFGSILEVGHFLSHSSTIQFK